MQALIVDLPRCPAVSTEAKADSGGSGYNLAAPRMGAHLVYVAVDIDGRLPGGATIQRSCDAADMHTGKNRCTIASGGHRSNTEWRPDDSAVDERRPRVPPLPALYLIESVEAHESPVLAYPYHLGIVGPEIDRGAHRNTTGERKIAARNRTPCACDAAPAQRFAPDDDQRVAAFAAHRHSSRLTGAFFMPGTVGEDTQSVTPRGDENSGHRHRNKLSRRRPAFLACSAPLKRVKASSRLYTFFAMRDLLDDAALRAARYLKSLDHRAVAPSKAALADLSKFATPLPEQPSMPQAVLAELDEFGSPATVASAGGRYFGFVTGGSLPATVAANWLATAWDQNAAMVVSSPACAALESVALDWLKDLFHLPAQSAGGFVTCATAANFSALAAARHALLRHAGWDVEAMGLFGAPPLTVIVGEEVHASVQKALSLVGFGRDRVIRVPVDGQGRMRIDEFPKLDDRTIVCTQAGNVNTGAFDPIGEICALARPKGAWVHVDGAFGLWAVAAPARTYLVGGVENADSWATDAHKWLNVPYDSGLVFTRDAGALRTAMSVGAAYLAQDGDRIPYQFTPDFSRRARGVEIWAALRQLGRRGLADLIEGTCRHASRFAEGLSAAGYRVLNEVVLNQVLVSFGSAERTRAVIGRIQEEGTCWCGGTVWQGHVAMRISVSSWATSEVDIEKSLQAILRAAAV